MRVTAATAFASDGLKAASRPAPMVVLSGCCDVTHEPMTGSLAETQAPTTARIKAKVVFGNDHRDRGRSDDDRIWKESRKDNADCRRHHRKTSSDQNKVASASAKRAS